MRWEEEGGRRGKRYRYKDEEGGVRDERLGIISDG